MSAEELSKAYSYAIKRLAAKAYLSGQLEKKLHEKEFTPPVAAQVIAKLQAQGFLNDQLWVTSFIQGHIRKKIGKQNIVAKLRMKGVSRDLIDEVIENVMDEHDPKEAIAELLKTKYAKKDLSDAKEKQKVVASLARRGFPLDTIFDVIRT